MADLVALSASAFSLGIISGGSPCALPLVPGFIGYLSAQAGKMGERARSFVGIAVILGVTTGMVVFALGAAVFHTSLTILISAATPVVVAVLILFGAMLIVNQNPFYRLPQVRIPRIGNPLFSAYAYGGLYGVIALPCSSLVILPFTIAVSLSSLSAIEAFLIFLTFGLGLGLPVVIVSILSRAQGDWLVKQFASRSRLMNTIAGIIMIGVALYDMIILYPSLQLFL
jgi:cytochrome c-type biogenesis protein